MRDPKRINLFLQTLEEYWTMVPDWRFGQLITNISRFYGGDIWFLEEDEFIKVMEKMFKVDKMCSEKDD